MTISLDKIHSLGGYSWQLRESDERTIAALIQKLALPEVVARVLDGRGVSLEEAEDFLNPTLRKLMPDPLHLLDMGKAANRLAKAVMKKQNIVIFGDYDVDGATSSALLKNFFDMLGHKVGVYIPDRITEGYGPNSEALRELKNQGAEIVVTVDCGTTAFEPLQTAAECGLEMIVIDHHLGAETLPVATAIVNPNRLDETSPHRHLAAVGVCFLLAVAIKSALKAAGWFETNKEPDLLSLLDLVAVGTVCDVVPLKGINRAFVVQGLKILAKRQNIGLAALADVANVSEPPGSYHLGFVLGPRINAGGRVGQADLGSRLLSMKEYDAAMTLASRLDHFNKERKAIEALVLEEAIAQAEQLSTETQMVCVAGEGWHPGVIGIVASRLKDRFNKPTAVIALSEGVGKASARSINGVDFGSAVVSARALGLLLAGGGHAMAAGFTVEEAKIPALQAFLSERFEADLEKIPKGRPLHLDGFLSINSLTPELLQLLEKAGPFGAGNPTPRFAMMNCHIIRVDILAEKHIRAIIGSHGSGSIKGMAFNAVETEMGQLLLNSKGKPLHIAGHAKINRWQGRESIEFMIDDVAL